ncbi:hypothetical protein BDF22DRAFT_694056 [Syncephalis plumigaleata]|nr:hypothetical protein BDF22DRAFT_694056 [Syncephalis plumigaleata]
MHLNLSIATAAVLLLASTTSAASLEKLLPKLGSPPVPNNDYPLNKWESAAGFDYMITRKLGGIGDVEYLGGEIIQKSSTNTKPKQEQATFTCVLVKEKMTTQVPRIYQILGPEPKSDPQNPADHVAHSIGGMWLAQHKYCYVSTKVCAKPYRQYYREIDNNQELSDTELRSLTEGHIDQVISVIKYLKSKKLAYNFSEDNVCFDVNNQLVLLRHDQARIVSKETMTPAELNVINHSIQSIIWDFIHLSNRTYNPKAKAYLHSKYKDAKYPSL